MNKIIEQIHHELEAAHGYMECASKHSGEGREMYKTLSKNEIEHAEKLMHFGNDKINKETNDFIIWNYEVDNFNSKIIKIKSELSLIS